MAEAPSSRFQEVGEVFKKSFDCEVIKWKIPDVSSLVISEGSEFLSPQFSYKGASWILKLYPEGHKDFRIKEGIVIVIERLHSVIPVHSFFCSFSFQCHVEVGSGRVISDSFVFHSNCKQKEVNFNKDWYQMLYHEKRSGKIYIINDTITLICEIKTKKDDIIELDTETKSLEADLSHELTKTGDSLNSTGELSFKSFNVDVLSWKIPNIRSTAVEVDNGIQSPTFAFADAAWIFQLFLDGQTKFNSEKWIDVVIERLHPQTARHLVSYTMFFRETEENELLSKVCNKIKRFPICNSCVFDADHTQENVIAITPYAIFLNIADAPYGIVLECEFRTQVNARFLLNFPRESIQSPLGNICPLSEDSAIPEIGKIDKESFECGAISWTLFNMSSLLKYRCVQSPYFSYKAAMCILKMLPNIKLDHVTVELHSQIPKHKCYCRLYFKDLRDVYDGVSESVLVDKQLAPWKEKCHSANIFEYKKYKHNDTITIICEILVKKDSITELDIEMELLESDLGRVCAPTGDTPLLQAGEISEEISEIDVIAWKIPKIFLREVREDDEFQSPSFTFAGSSWMLKMCPFGQKKSRDQRNVDVEIQRLQSELPKHFVAHRIFYTTIENFFNRNVFYNMLFDRFYYSCNRGFRIFDPSHVGEKIINIMPYDSLTVPSQLCDTVVLGCELRSYKTDESGPDF